MSDASSTPAREPVLTVGHGNRTDADFLGLLRAAEVAHVVDVRSFPRSRRFPWFSRQRLEAMLADAGIGYTWMGRALGGKRRGRPGATALHPALDPGFAAFAVHMGTPAFAAACGQLLALAQAHPTALLCAERDPRRCHRALIADHLRLVDGVEVVHWLEPAQSRRHRAHEAARVAEPGVLRYDGGGTGSLWPEP